MRKAFFLLLFWWCSGAFAGSVVGSTVAHSPSGTSAVFSETGSVLDQITSRTVLSQVVNNSVQLSDIVDATVAGNRISLANARSITLAEVAAATVAVGSAAYAGCAAGTAIANYAGLGNGTNNGSRLGCNLAEWVLDEGVDAPSTSGTLYQVIDTCKSTKSGCTGTGGNLYTQWSSSMGAACTQYANSFTTYASVVGTVSSGTCYWVAYNSTGSMLASGSTGFYSKQGTSSDKCPATIDALNPAYSLPEGHPPGPDGKCATGRYTSVSADAARRVLTLYGVVEHAPDMVKWLSDGKHDIPVADNYHLTGPGSVTGSPVTSTTTNPDGSTVTTTSTPTTNYTYNGPNVSWTVTNVTNTQTCVQAGSCTTTTTTTDNQQKSECELNPASAGCGGNPASAGSIYAKKDRTFQTVLTAGRDSILATPLGSAMGNFFTIAGGGSCPIWTWDIPYIKAVVVVDEFCSDWALTAYSVMKGAVLIVFAWVAFRWAVL